MGWQLPRPPEVGCRTARGRLPHLWAALLEDRAVDCARIAPIIQIFSSQPPLLLHLLELRPPLCPQLSSLPPSLPPIASSRLPTHTVLPCRAPPGPEHKSQSLAMSPVNHPSRPRPLFTFLTPDRRHFLMTAP